MDYGDINNRWKQFLTENTFKKDNKKKLSKKNIDKKTSKEIIVSEEEEDKLEGLEEMSSCSGGGVQGYAGTQEENEAKEEE